MIWAHILGIALYVGPQFFLAFAVVPASRNIADRATRIQLTRTVTRKFGMIGGIGLGLFMSFSGRVNVATALIYSVFEGVLLGAISRVFEQAYHGIVIQAVTGTVMVAVGILFVYKIGAIRVTPRFTRIVVGATIGALGLMVVNLVAYLFTPDGLGLRSGGVLAIGFSLVCIVLAAMNLVLDFDMIERGIRNGADQKFAWYASFGITVTLVWLYLEILRLLGYLRN